ncbi:hypothetical protein Syun_024997 [Stephania yunnanensis]|uniref:Uncharacterized protein n=1 Tax=Stephania yunnanensis TaxID=152371 RepID=A0AAP0EW60_9MAGN
MLFGDGRVRTLLVGAKTFWATLSDCPLHGQGPTSTFDFDILLAFGKRETE